MVSGVPSFAAAFFSFALSLFLQVSASARDSVSFRRTPRKKKISHCGNIECPTACLMLHVLVYVMLVRIFQIATSFQGRHVTSLEAHTKIGHAKGHECNAYAGFWRTSETFGTEYVFLFRSVSNRVGLILVGRCLAGKVLPSGMSGDKTMKGL